MSLNQSRFGDLLDFYGAQRDIKEGTIRVLHNLSFVEDPTRVFRAIRFEQRFSFKMSRHTHALIANAVKLNFFEKLSGKRLFSELVLILKEERPIKAINRMAELGLLRFIHPRLRFGEKEREVIGNIIGDPCLVQAPLPEREVRPLPCLFDGSSGLTEAEGD